MKLHPSLQEEKNCLEQLTSLNNVYGVYTPRWMYVSNDMPTQIIAFYVRFLIPPPVFFGLGWGLGFLSGWNLVQQVYLYTTW